MDSDNIEQTESVEPCWPFWGQLKQEKTNFGEIRFTRPDNDYFDRLYAIGFNALRILKCGEIEDIRDSAIAIQREIDAEIDAQIEADTDQLAAALSANGGYQLQYLPEDSPATFFDIKYLLKNWSSEWDDPSGITERDNYNILYVFIGILDRTDGELFQFGIFAPEPQKLYAVLALMTICDAIHSNPIQRLGYRVIEPINKTIKSIGVATIQAVEIMAFIDLIDLKDQIEKSFKKETSELLKRVSKEQISQRATKAAFKRHKNDPKQTAKIFVRECWNDWQKEPNRYKSKAAFARDMREKYPNLESQPVLENWCRTWECTTAP